MIHLQRLPGGGFDIGVSDAVDGEHQAVATVLYALLYTDQRAPEGREADGFAARGWWHDPQAGSGLWHVRRQGLTDAARRETVDMITDALSKEPALTNVEVADLSPQRSDSRMDVRITGLHNGRQFLIDLPL